MQTTYTNEANREARTQCTIYARRAMNAINALLGGNWKLYGELEDGYLATLGRYADGTASHMDVWRTTKAATMPLQDRVWDDKNVTDDKSDSIDELIYCLRQCAWVGEPFKDSEPQFIDMEVQAAERFGYTPTSIKLAAEIADRISYAQDLALQAFVAPRS